MNKEQILYLKKQGSSWCMEKKTFFSFLTYISNYFTPRNAPAGFDPEKLCFAEISHSDMYELCGIFGGYLTDDDTLALIPLGNGSTIPWGNTFVLTVYEAIEGVCTPRKVNMVLQC